MNDKPTQLQENDANTLCGYMDTCKAADYLCLSRQYLEGARHKGGGPKYYKLARAVRYRRSDLDQWMLDRQQRHTGENSQ